MKPDVRAQALADFRAGVTQVLCNVAVLTEGFDDPGVSCVAMARPTRSEGLYAQCVGRGTRLHPGKQDCLILDFVDVSQLSLCSLPSLFGVPRELDLRGEDVSRARQTWQQILLDHPGFELEAGSFTLPQIQQRAESFDPLTLETNAEVSAISANAWFSLGRHGLGLHFERRPGVSSEVTVLARAARGKRWEVSIDGRVQERFSSIEAAVEAVDYELSRRGREVAGSARPEAAWRGTRAEALRLAVWQRVVGATTRAEPKRQFRA
jgi:ATP-dependent helicase IRC3